MKKIGAPPCHGGKGYAMLGRAGERRQRRAAEAATIAIMVGGDRKVFDDALPVCSVPPPAPPNRESHEASWAAGTVAKRGQHMMAFCNAAARRGGGPFDFFFFFFWGGVTAGLDPKKLIQVVANASGQFQRLQEHVGKRAER